jgi:hypothetical protein
MKGYEFLMEIHMQFGYHCWSVMRFKPGANGTSAFDISTTSSMRNLTMLFRVSGQLDKYVFA